MTSIPRALSNKVRGKGDYQQIKESVVSALNTIIPKGTFSRLLGAAGTAAGERIVPGAGGVVGGNIGNFVGSKIAKFTGFGDYMQGGDRSSPIRQGNMPTFAGASNGVRIKHRELFMQVSGSTSFAIDRLMINPGNKTMFPWLSQVASAFEQWKAHGMFFLYEPLSGAINSASASLGDVMLASQYDVFDETFRTKAEMLNYEFASSSIPCGTMLHAIECDPKQTQQRILKVRHGPVPTGATRQNYDLADLSVGTQGQPSVYVCGQIWVVYDIEFLKQKIAVGTNFEAATMRVSGAGLVTAAKPIGDTGCVVNWHTSSNIPINVWDGEASFTAGLDRGSSNQIRVNTSGFVRVIMRWNSPSGSINGLPTLGGGTIGTTFPFDPTSYTATSDPAWSILDFTAYIPTQGSLITVTGPVGLTDGTLYCTVIRIPADTYLPNLLVTPYSTTYPLLA